MKTHIIRKHQKHLSVWMSSVALAVVALLLGTVAIAGGVTKYNIQDWIAAQGSNYDLDGDGTWEQELFANGGDLWVPPSNNYWGWSAPTTNPQALASVDYAGIAARYLKNECGIDLGTTFSGSVSSRDLGDGQKLVSVNLHAKNVLAYGMQVTEDLNGDGQVDGSDWDFYLQPLYFGARVEDICKGATPSVGSLEAVFEYTVNANPIVDINAGALSGEVTSFRKMMMRSSSRGTLINGTPAIMTIGEAGIFMPNSQSTKYDGFPVEFIKFQPIGNK